MFACLLLCCPPQVTADITIFRNSGIPERAACDCRYPDLDPDPARYLWRFPTEDVADAALAACDDRLAWIGAQEMMDFRGRPDPVWDAMREGVRWRRRCWQALADAHYCYRHGIRISEDVGPFSGPCLDAGEWLDMLRELIGPEAFERGLLPLP